MVEQEVKSTIIHDGEVIGVSAGSVLTWALFWKAQPDTDRLFLWEVNELSKVV